MPLRAEVRCRPSTQTPHDPIAQPFQSFQFPALGLGIALADVNVPAPLESKFLPARIRGQRQIKPLAFPMRRVEGRNFARGALVCLFGLALDHLADFCAALQDRKSTRLNSSHRTISYAVFCLKK